MAGVAFRYHTNRHYYLFSLEDGKKVRLRLRLPRREEDARGPVARTGHADFTYDSTQYYTLKVENDGPRMKAYVDGKLLIEATDNEILKGKAGVTANNPARFTDFRVTRIRRRREGDQGSHRQARGRAEDACAPTIPSPSCGRNSASPTGARAATRASATWTATACPIC